MPLIQPTSGRTLDIEKRMRALLTADPTLTGLFHLPIRGMTPDGVTVEEDVVVSLFTSDEDFSPETLASTRTAPRIILDITVAEPETASVEQLEAIRERIVALTTLFRDAIWKIRGDPTLGDRLWWGLKFKMNPTTVYERTPQKHQRSRTHFDVFTQKANP